MRRPFPMMFQVTREDAVVRTVTLLMLLAACGPARVPAFPHPITGACPGATATLADTATIATDLDSLDESRANTPRYNRVFPRIPWELFDSSEPGRVVASFVLDSVGRVDPHSIVILEASDPRYAASVCETLPRMDLTPRTRNGRIVTARVRFDFNFLPANAPRPLGTPPPPPHN
jgi:hypothetical protein